MENRIRNYIERAFEDAPKTNKANELKEELILNLIEKFNGQLSRGKSEDEAYSSVISGIGDLSELIDGLREQQVFSRPSRQETKKSAIIISVSVSLYILSIMVLIIFAGFLKMNALGLTLMFIMVAGATSMLIYNSLAGPKYYKDEETLVEEFKEWKSGKDKNKALYSAISGAYWMIIVVVYFLISFLLNAWAYSWLLFIIAAAAQNILKAVMLYNSKD